MDTTELDRLEQSIRRALERIGSLETSNRQLADEKNRLEKRLKERATPIPRPDPPLAISPERLAEVKARLIHLIDEVKEQEQKL